MTNNPTTPTRYYSHSWKKQRHLKKNFQDITRDTMLERINHLRYLNERALVSLLYLTGARITEVVRRRWKFTPIYKTRMQTINGRRKEAILRNANRSPIAARVDKERVDEKSMLRKHITFSEHGGKRIMVVLLRNRKNRKTNLKRLPIHIDGNDAGFVDIVLEFINEMPRECELFPYQASRARRIVAKIGMNPHFLRDIRLTHLVVDNEFDVFDLQKFAGWSGIQPAEHYVLLSVKDLVRKL